MVIRILIVTHAPLSAETGAGQMAINLADAVREQGHDVTLWSPQPLPEDIKWWRVAHRTRSKLDYFINTQKSFDVIDSPAALITPTMKKSALIVVARSVQPDLLYIIHSLNIPRESSIIKKLKLLSSYFYSWFLGFLVLQGWRRAKYILCLGSLELNWMKKWFPWWRGKLISYANALSQVDSEALAKIRQNRGQYQGGGIRFLWIGRWVNHKGITELLEFIVERAVSHPQDTFTIAGCGTEALKDCPSELFESGRLKVVPSFERSQLYSLIASHDVGLFTSRVEGWGLVLNEMLESGMPIFATPVGGVPDLQPFFREMLRPFPPSLESMFNISARPENPSSYYSVFNWSQIAKLYTEFILNPSAK